jgi:hypothetical protein
LMGIMLPAVDSLDSAVADSCLFCLLLVFLTFVYFSPSR